MIKKANISWTAKQYVKMMEKGSIVFDNSIQRGYVWDSGRKSLLIHSMIAGYPIPAFYAAKDENGNYSMLDGRQRSETIRSFMANEFSLCDLPEIETDNGLVDISGLDYSQLIDDMKDSISGYSLNIYYFDNITDDEVSEMFYRLNNGKPLSTFDIMRSRIKDHDQIKIISKHPLFEDALTEKALKNNKSEEFAIKAWAALYMDNPSFERKPLEDAIIPATITQEQTDTIMNAFTRIKEAHNLILDYETKESTRAAKRILVRTHLISLVPVAVKSVNDNIDTVEFSEWVTEFFNPAKTTSISEAYNYAAGSGSAKAENVRKRHAAIMSDYKTRFGERK